MHERIAGEATEPDDGGRSGDLTTGRLLARQVGAAATLVALGLSAVHCGGDDFGNCEESRTCAPDTNAAGAGADGSAGANVEGGAGQEQPGAGGQPGGPGEHGGAGGAGGQSESPPEPCLGTSAVAGQCELHDQDGIFVSVEGDDTTGDGTMAKPYATIAKALESEGAPEIFVCAGDTPYSTAPLMVTKDHDGAGLFGGFSCVDWSRTQERTVVSSTGTNVLTLQNLRTGYQIHSFELNAADAAGSGESSIAVKVLSSSNVSIQGVVIRAGAGGKGADGSVGATGDDGLAPGAEQNGADLTMCTVPNTAAGGKGAAPICVSKGGNGSDGANANNATAGVPATNLVNFDYQNQPLANTNNASTATSGDLSGGNGKNGKAGSNAAMAASTGTFSTDGYLPADGHAGNNGFPGQGGGGGSSDLGWAACDGPGGGAGGMGGCGGKGGGPGAGGGASVALLSFSSDVVIGQDCELVAKAGGAGGAGGDPGPGGSGKPGGKGGKTPPDPAYPGGDGGHGGNGGRGGPGSGGSGGPSCAIVYQGATPTIEIGATLTPAGGGKAGGGTVPGSAGISAELFEAP